MKRFKLNEIWTLLKWILLYEVILGVLITILNFFFDLEQLYKSVSITNFISYEFFSLFLIIVIELLGLTQLYLFWYRKYGKKPKSRLEIIKKLLLKSESKKIEFKKSLRWDFEKEEFNKELEKAVIKTIAAFLNSEGGNLIIGVSDKKEIEGLDKDFQTLPKKNGDGFENYLTQAIRSSLGSQRLRLITIEFHSLEEKKICIVMVKKSEDPVFTKINGKEEFFVRVGNSTASLDISEAVEYIKNHWNSDPDLKNNTSS